MVAGTTGSAPLIGFPKIWARIVKGTALAEITPHVHRHSFASVSNDLGFTEVTVASLVGHPRGTITSRYIHTVDTALVMAADGIAGYINGLLDNIKVKRKTYALDRASRLATLQDLFENQAQETSDVARQSAA